jgi:hypothetical protein
MIRMKPTEIPTPVNEEAINPELVEAIKRAKRSGPMMTHNKWLDQYTALSHIVATRHAAGR